MALLHLEEVTKRLLKSLKSGIFPWFEDGEPITWGPVPEWFFG
jgi:Leu/Phe-tRNA-protein transferase